MITVRPSKQDLFIECPSSALNDDGPSYNPPSDASALGSAAHELIAVAIDQDGFSEGAAQIIARKYDVDADELMMMGRFALRAWTELGDFFPDPTFEAPIDSTITGPGTADVLSVSPQAMAVLDWKSGRVQRQHRGQILGYAMGIYEQFGMPETGYISGVIVWLRLGTYDVYRFTEADFKQVAAAHLERTQRVGKEYNPGEHCGFCSRQLRCVALQAYQHGSAMALANMPEGQLAPNLATLYPRVQMLEKAIERYREALRLTLSEGPVDLEDGREIALVEARRTAIDPRRAWSILSHNLSEEQLASCVTIGKGKLEDAIGETAERGQKAARCREVFEVLARVGAVTESFYNKLEVRRKAGK